MIDPTYSKIYLSGFAAGKEKTEKILREERRKKVAAGTAAAKKKGRSFWPTAKTTA